MENQTSFLKTAVIGPGAIGGVTAALMKKAGFDPILVCKHQAIVDRIHDHGVSIRGRRGSHRVALTAVKDIRDLPADIDLFFLATKANDCLDAARTLKPLLKDGAMLVSMQNGIAEEGLAQVVGSGPVVGCVVGWGATYVGAAELEVTSKGEFVIGNWDRQSASGRLSAVQRMLEAVQPTRTSDNIVGELYAKLIINACINALGVITGETLGDLLARRRIRRLFVTLMREAMTVADAMGIRVEPAAGGKLDYYRLLSGTGLSAQLKRDLIIRIIGFKYRKIKSSSLQSLERGRPTEIDYLNGYIADKARAHGVAVPANDAVVAMVNQIQEGSRLISPANLDDPVFTGL